MTKHDEARRAFLLGAAVGAGAVAGATLVPDALAQTRDAPTTGTGAAHSHAGGPGLGAFFNSEDAATVAAFTERLVPGAAGKPGAREADVINYIDLALAGAYADLQYTESYGESGSGTAVQERNGRRGLAQLPRGDDARSLARLARGRQASGTRAAMTARRGRTCVAWEIGAQASASEALRRRPSYPFRRPSRSHSLSSTVLRDVPKSPRWNTHSAGAVGKHALSRDQFLFFGLTWVTPICIVARRFRRGGR